MSNMSSPSEVPTGSALPPGTAVDRVFNVLREGILTSRFAPGQRLVEVDLTQELGVSRGPLREAFRRLSAEGLIEIVPNRGALVRRLSFPEIIELFEIRTELEALAARRAASKIGDAGLRKEFEAAIAPIWSDEPRLSSVAYIDENARFHRAIVELSGNTQLGIISRQLQLQLILSQMSHALTVENLNKSVLEHREIAELILAGSSHEADVAIRKHFARAADLIRKMPAAYFRT